MKGLSLAAVLLLIGAQPALAQAPLVRGDMSGTLGWFNANKGGLNSYDDWYNRSLIGEFGVGWYWTNQLKTEVTTGVSTEASDYGQVLIDVGGQTHYVPSRSTFATRRVSIAQQYQFGENQWFHPYLGAGLDLEWERRSRLDQPLYTYDSITRQNRLVRGAVEHPKQTELRALASASGGFKAYMTRRGFLRSELRVTFSGGPEEVVLRFGFGVDF